MNRRILAVVLALGLALLGTIALVSYVRGADARALAGVRTTSVLVVNEAVAQGTPASELADSVRLEQIPVKVAATGSVADLADLGDQVALVDLEPGEQVLVSRFADASTALPSGIVAVPPGEQEISVLLEPQRVVGGRLRAGDEIGVYVSMTGGGEETSTRVTSSVLHGVLVTQVQGAPAPAETGEPKTAAASGAAPASSLMVTMALTARDAERVIFGMEHGTLWLSLEPAGADNSGTQLITPDDIYAGVLR